MYKTVQIDLGNNNWRYVTGIYGSQDIGCSIYPNEKITEDRLIDCQKILFKHTFKVVEVK